MVETGRVGPEEPADVGEQEPAEDPADALPSVVRGMRVGRRITELVVTPVLGHPVE